MTDPAAIRDAIRAEAEQVLVGNASVIDSLTIALLTRGHVLLEGVPGIAKTTIANLFARASGLEYRRVQMTPDILPADITGSHVYREATGEFNLQRGPVFANVVVADEINRATPKTQSALLEAMEERQATIEGETFELPQPFVVIATQNPIEMEGTFELPEAQRDRFQQKLIVDLPDRDHERELFERFQSDPFLGPEAAEQVVEPQDILDAQRTVSDVHVADELREYVLDVVRATRTHEAIEYGASPRATLAFLNGGRARAAIEGREYVLPGDVKALAEPVLAHRLVLTTDAELGGRTPRDVVRAIVDDVATPSGSLADDTDTDSDTDSDSDPAVPAED
jgi:MoxR-like ATPase